MRIFILTLSVAIYLALLILGAVEGWHLLAFVGLMCLPSVIYWQLYAPCSWKEALKKERESQILKKSDDAKKQPAPPPFDSSPIIESTPDSSAKKAPPIPPPLSITVKEAFEVLGLDCNASHEEVIRAHRSLLKKYHPDQGGSNHLAKLINEAKTVLMREFQNRI